MAMAKNMSYTRGDTLLLYLGEIVISGIYRIFSIATGESYYGSSKHIKRRFIEHRSLWKNNKGNHKIRSLLKRYGEGNLKFEILEECSPVQFELKEKEYIEKDEKRLNVWISPFSSKGCNLGDHVKGKKFIGHKHTNESKNKIRESNKKYYETHDGFWLGKNIPEETRAKVSVGLKEYFSKNPNPRKGKPLSEETRKKISNTLKNRGVL